MRFSGSDLQKQAAREWAQERNLDYTEIEGSSRLILMLMDGRWEEAEFLVVQPGEKVSTACKDGIIKAV